VGLLLVLLSLLAIRIAGEQGKGKTTTEDAPKSSPTSTAINSTVVACKTLKDTLQHMTKQTCQNVFR
jgi:hypothetical protein